MAIHSIGDLSASLLLRQRGAALRDELSQLGQELVTGRSARPDRRLQGDLGALAALAHRSATLAAHADVTAETQLLLSSTQASLDRLGAAADTAGKALRAASVAGLRGPVDIAAENAREAFGDAVAALNTSVAGRGLFSGTEPGATALAPAGGILAALNAATAGADTPEALAQAVRDWFADPAGLAAMAYGGGPRAQAGPRLDGGTTLPPAPTALAPEITATLAALATGALLAEGRLDGDPAARRTLAAFAADMLIDAEAGLVTLQARVGDAEARAEAALVRNRSEADALSVARSGLVGVDPYETASRIEDVRSRIETLYLITARLSRLSLAEYLR